MPVHARGAAVSEGDVDEHGVAIEQVVERVIAHVPQVVSVDLAVDVPEPFGLPGHREQLRREPPPHLAGHDEVVRLQEKVMF
jgi:hypothetical protein